MQNKSKPIYETPTVELLSVSVEQGFAASLDASGGFIGTADDVPIFPATSSNPHKDGWDY